MISHKKATERSSLKQARVERDLVQPVSDIAGRARYVGTMERVDLDQDDITGFAFVDQREQCRVAHITAVPIGFAVDFDSFEHERQTGRSHHAVERDCRFPEDFRPAGADVGRCQKHLDATRVVDPVEIDAAGNHLA